MESEIMKFPDDKNFEANQQNGVLEQPSNIRLRE